MGAFYGAVYFRAEDRDAVRRILEEVAGKRQCRFLLGPALGGWVAAYPEMHGQDERVAKAVAKRFDGEVLYVLVHDSDIFAYTYFRGGKVADEFNSCPDYFEEAAPHVKERCRGRPERLAHLLAPGKSLADLRRLLSPEGAEGTVFADDLLGEFADLLGLPNAQTSYEYLKAGETEGWDQFLHVPDDSAEKARKREAEESIDRVKERLRTEGLLFLEKSADAAGLVPPQPVWCPDREGSGFLVGWGGMGLNLPPAPLEHYAPPWTTPAVTAVALDGVLQYLAASPSGRYLAFSSASRRERKVRLWDLDTNAVVLERADLPPGEWLRFSPDERYVVLVWSVGQTAGEGIVLEIPGGRRVASFQVEQALRAAVHPSGVILVNDALSRLTFVDLASGRVGKTLYFGGRQALNPGYQAMLAQAVQQIQHLDPDALERSIRARMEKQAKAMEQVLRQQQAIAGTPGVEELVRRVRERTEKIVAQMKQMAERSKKRGAGEFAAVAQGSERLMCLECSQDGRLVFAGTDHGVRVFTWDALAAAADVTPPPALAVEPEKVIDERGHGTATTRSVVHALAHDVGGNRLLFGGPEGKVRFLDLATGRGGTLLDPPGRSALQRLGLSRDRSALCCTCQPYPFMQGEQRRPPLLQVWNYAALEQRLAGG